MNQGTRQHRDTHERAQGVRPRGSAAGFTLPELLIAITIFLSVAGGIALLFTNSIRTVKVGHQNIDVSEEIRGAMDLIETDLTQAFTSRDYGDYYTFYGSPIGMTFVGLVRPSRDGGQPNLSRITYVLYGGARDTFQSYEQYAGVPDNVPATYQLLRYIEPDRDGLEDLPIAPHRDNTGRWVPSRWPDPLNPNEPVPAEGLERNLYWELWEAANCFSTGTFDSGRCINSGGRFLCEEIRPGVADPNCVQEVIRSKKRELWIRMLAGDKTLPPFWAEDGNTGIDAPSYKDYILAEDVILTQDVPPGFDITKDNIITLTPLPNNPNSVNPAVQPWPERSDGGPAFNPFRPFFVYGSCCVNGQPVFYPYWSDRRNMVGLGADVTLADGSVIPVPEGQLQLAFGSPVAPRIPMMVNVQLQFLQASPYAGAPDLFRNFTKQIDVPSGYTRSDLTG